MVQKDSNVKKESYSWTGILKIVYQIYHSKQGKQKRKSKFFYPDNFELP